MKLRLLKTLLAAALAALAFAENSARAADESAKVSRELDDYIPLFEPLTGRIVCTGSSNVGNLLNRWAVAFHEIYPGVEIIIANSSAKEAATALAARNCDLAPAARDLTAAEIDEFTCKAGYPPTKIIVAVDAVAVFVEKNNPVKSLTLQQIDSLLSRTFNRDGGPVQRWGQVGVTGPLADATVVRYAATGFADAAAAGRSNSSDVFKTVALKGGEFSLQTNHVFGASSVVQGIGADPAGVGVASVFNATRRTRQVPIRLDDGAEIAPTYDNVIAGKYPLTRFLQLYINKPPGKDIDLLTLEFLRYIVSEDGQSLVAKDGNMPLTPPMARQQLINFGAIRPASR